MDVADLWRRNFVVVLGFMIFFWITQVIAIEYWPVSLCTEFSSNNKLMTYLATNRRWRCRLLRQRV